MTFESTYYNLCDKVVETLPQDVKQSLNVQEKHMEDAEIRGHLCVVLSQMRKQTRVLMGLMGQHNFVTLLSDKHFPLYAHAVEQLSAVSTEAVDIIEKSYSLDRRHLLKSLLLDEGTPRQ